MKMIMISYNEAVEAEVMEALQESVGDGWTKIPGVFGKGAHSGTHLGNDIWPGRNTMLFAACSDAQAPVLMEHVRQLRAVLGKEGVKAFMFGLEAAT